jgi:hypothetical protein
MNVGCQIKEAECASLTATNSNRVCFAGHSLQFSVTAYVDPATA